MKKFLSLVLALIMAMSLVTISAGAMDFTDADDVDYAEAVEVISALGIVSGNNGAFMPKEFLTRQAAAKIVASIALGTDKVAKLPTGTAPFTDVPAGNHFAGYISYLKDLGIVGGYGDGSFGPRAFLTGDAFLKQVLGVLGYKADIEGYSGNGWQVSVAIDAANAGLLEGLEDINTAANITREQAAQVMLNALQADVVSYGERYTLDVGGLVLSYGEVSSKAAGSVDYDKGTDGDDTMQLCEQVFPKLAKDDTVTDNFARPAVKWALDSKEICTVAETPVLTYTVTPSYANLYADLGLEEAGKWKAFVDGVAYTNASGSSGPFTLTGGLSMINSYILGGQSKYDGSVHEVYFDEDTKVATVIVINEYLGEISAVSEPVDDTTERTVALKQVGDAGLSPYTSDTTFSFSGYETEEFEKGDVVVYTFSKKLKNAGKTAAQSVQSMALAETKSGKITRLGGTTLVYLDGVSVRRASCTGLVFAEGSAQYGDAATAYLNSNGYFLQVEADASANNYAVLLDAKVDSSVLFGENKNMVQLLLTDGSVEIVEADKDYSSSALVGEFVKYNANNKGQYALTDARSGDLATGGLNGNTVWTKNGAASMGMNSTGATHAVNALTTFIIKELDADEKEVYNIYTGNKAVPTITGDSSIKVTADLVVSETNAKLATYVYIDATNEKMVVDTTSSSDALMFVHRNSSAKFSDDNGAWYNVYAVVEGSVKAIQYDYDSGSTLAGTFTLFEKYTINSNGYYVGSNAISAKVTNKVGVKYADGILAVGTAGTNSVANYFVLADDCIVATLDYTKNLGVTTADSIEEDATDLATVYVDDETGEAILVLIQKKV